MNREIQQRFILFYVLIFCSMCSLGQTIAKPFISEDIFQTRFFIENKGQFNAFDQGKCKVKYAVDNNGDHVYFNPNGVVWNINKIVMDSMDNDDDKEHGGATEEDQEKRTVLEDNISMNWLGANPNCTIESEGKSKHYFTYGEAQYSSYGYERITYRNLYPAIDVVYTIPEKGGIKYTIMLHKGADLGKVRFTYAGSDVLIRQEDDRLIIQNDIRDLVESELKVSNEEGKSISCRFKVEGNEIGFEFVEPVDHNKEIMLDPWVAPITTLTTIGYGNNKGYDVDYDYDGNLYVYGGGYWYAQPIYTENTKVAKYSSAGSLLWTFNGTIVSPSWESKGYNGPIGNFVNDRLNGKTYIGQGFNPPDGTSIVRLSTAGVYDNFISTPNSNFNEIWEMNFDCNTGNVFGMGGGTSSNINMGVINSAGNFNTANITGHNGAYQDILSSAISNSGEIFVAMVSSDTNLSVINRKIIKLNASLNGNLWIEPTGFSTFWEGGNKPYLQNGPASNGFNALYVNQHYLFYYDGLNVKAFNKNNGAGVGSPVTNYGDTAEYQGGIYADECDNIYVGGNSGNLKVFHFNGSVFSSLQDLLIPGMAGKHIYDIKYNSGNDLMYVSGESFVATVSRSILCLDSVMLNAVLVNACGRAILNLINQDSTAQYSFIWTDSTTNTVVQSHINVGLSDTLQTLISGHVYTILLTKNSQCGRVSRVWIFMGTNYIQSVLNPQICDGQSFSVNNHVYSASGTYIDTLQALTGCDTIVTTNLLVVEQSAITQSINLCNGQQSIVNGHVYTNSGTYLDTMINIYGCDSMVTTILTVMPNSSWIQNSTLCGGQSIIVNGHTYTNTGIYHDTLTNSQGCDSVITTNLIVHPLSYYTQNFTFCNGQSVTVNNHTYSASGTYHDTMINALGCDSVITTHLTIQPLILQTQNRTICEGNTIDVNGHTYTQSGVYIDTLMSTLSCDTLLTTNLTVYPHTSFTQQVALCEGESIQVNGHTYATSGHYKDTLLNANGCDSIVSTDLQVNVNTLMTQEIKICNGHSITINQHTYTTSGVYTDTISNASGCDSIIITSLDVDYSADGNFFIANVFTPNNDNLNDCFGVNYWKDIQEIKFIIYNRWGQVVFATDQVWDCWNGNYKGENAEQGVYFYFIKAKTTCGEVIYKGDVTLLR